MPSKEEIEDFLAQRINIMLLADLIESTIDGYVEHTLNGDTITPDDKNAIVAATISALAVRVVQYSGTKKAAKKIGKAVENAIAAGMKAL